MELDIYELYVLHIIKVRLLSMQPLEDGEQYVMACQLLLRIEEIIIKSMINKLNDKSLFTDFIV